MGPRRSHRKSRNGCPECKQRRLKCDERFPCTNCVKHAISCSYAPPKEPIGKSTDSVSPASQPQGHMPSPQPTVYGHSQPGSQASTPSSGFSWMLSNADINLESEDRLDLLGLLPSAPTSSIAPQNPSVPKEDWALDLELMHYFCSVTCNYMAIREDLRHVWRVIIPMEGYQNKYVMHGILAIAAVHRASQCSNPTQKQRLLRASAYHLAAGLKEFRELIALPIDPANWQPVFCFASMIAVLVCTGPIRLGVSRWPDPISNMVELFASIKGFQSIMKPFLPSLSRTQLAPLAHAVWIQSEMTIASPSVIAQSILPPDIWDQIARLHQFIDEYPFPECDQSHLENPQDNETQAESHKDNTGTKKDYSIALTFYENCTRQLELAGPHVETGMAFMWAYPLSKQFHQDLEAHRPAALVLLAYYCVLLQSIDNFWYIKGTAWQVLEDIETKMDPLFQEWLVWPKQWVFR
ncbi:hypothetical protein N7462_005831 [Penicillium macrosclerotiorum]|uniref:uncharacterized protein n=1 Tax=Penicillium macrosclerotiorum TaxID=303699 RepID=UPI0025472418|nr:uncharacterized protein N7462_005831 [Penicillium macrosclerotiorum]KAJ5682666.1 hypothetical protein N7462_005831 [Penicillium macrosclerotiorum]